MDKYRIAVSLDPDNSLAKDEADKITDFINKIEGDCSGFVLILCHEIENSPVSAIQTVIHRIGSQAIINAIKSSETLSRCASMAVLCNAFGTDSVEIDDIPEKGGENSGN